MKCEKKDCNEKAVVFAQSLDGEMSGNFCLLHAERVASRGHDEYVATCPKCGSIFGVGNKQALPKPLKKD